MALKTTVDVRMNINTWMLGDMKYNRDSTNPAEVQLALKKCIILLSHHWLNNPGHFYKYNCFIPFILMFKIQYCTADKTRCQWHIAIKLSLLPLISDLFMWKKVVKSILRGQDVDFIHFIQLHFGQQKPQHFHYIHIFFFLTK